jgi:hypothetical protein
MHVGIIRPVEAGCPFLGMPSGFFTGISLFLSPLCMAVRSFQEPAGILELWRLLENVQMQDARNPEK